jgi:hypothetical protein
MMRKLRKVLIGLMLVVACALTFGGACDGETDSGNPATDSGNPVTDSGNPVTDSGGGGTDAGT